MTGFCKYVPRENKTYYLASPYSHKNPVVKEFRELAVQYTASILTMKGYKLLEPIASCHRKSHMFDLPTGYEYWKERDRDYIARSDGVILLAIKGWKESVGVTDELEYANELGIPIYKLGQDAVLSRDLLAEMFILPNESITEIKNVANLQVVK